MRIDHRAPQRAKEKLQVEKDPLYAVVRDGTPEEAAQWVRGYVKDLQTAREALELVFKMLARQEREGTIR